MSAAAVKIATKLKLATSLANTSVAAAEALKAGAPKSVLTIPYAVQHGPLSRNGPNDSGIEEPTRSPGAVIVQVGATRRISTLDPYLTCEEMDGLAYRIKILGRNESLNSILLANNVEKNSGDIILPASALEMEKQNGNILEHGTSPEFGKVYHAFGGYDARALHGAAIEEKRATLKAMTKLALSVKGGVPSNHPDEDDTHHSKIPFLSIPHGLITDGGYALAMGSYVLATSDSRFRIENPLRGLSLDPIGLSYILPRLGCEFDQPSAHYPVGSILALTGYEADASDMVETGLATHFIDSFRKFGSLERALAQLEPYGQQRLAKDPPSLYGAKIKSGKKKVDVNMKYRNVAIASLLGCFSAYDAAGQEVGDVNYMYQRQMDEDPSLVLDSDKVEMCKDRESMLLNIAATFQDVFEGEDSMEGILECMKEFAAKQASNEEESEFVDTAKEIVENIEAQSPLAVKAVHKLMEIGNKKSATLEGCMAREEKVQLKLLDMEDFTNWAKSGAEAGHFFAWKHKSIADVSSDEVEELLG